MHDAFDAKNFGVIALPRHGDLRYRGDVSNRDKKLSQREIVVV